MRRRGVSLIELLVACSLFLLLTAALFLSWAHGSKAWLIASQRADLTTSAQLVMRRLEKGLEASSSASISFQNDVLSFASCFGPENSASSTTFVASADPGSVNWQKFAVAYRKSADRQLWFREYPVAAVNPAYLSATQIQAVDFGSGPQALLSYATGGKKICDFVDALRVTQTDLLLTVQIDLSIGTTRRGSYTSSTQLRN